MRAPVRVRVRVPVRVRVRALEFERGRASELLGDEVAALDFGEPSPDAVRFAHAQRKVETLDSYGAPRADDLGLGLAHLAHVTRLD
jgi:hypothetical protein